MHSGWEPWGVVPSRQSQTHAKSPPAKPRRNQGFAKVPVSGFCSLPSFLVASSENRQGVRVPKHEAPTQRIPEPTGPTIESDDENEGESIEDWI
jgi:hypothetical protein